MAEDNTAAADCPASEALILEEEMQDLGCRAPLRGMGLSMLGPVLLEYGTEEQRQEHIPKIVRG